MANPFSNIEKKFSLCVPCHGDKYKHFERFFDALEKQDYKNFETIITFDGRNKRGEKELKKMIEKFPNQVIKYDTIEHAGACAARNNSVRLATGDFYAFPSPDCWLYPSALKIWANEFEDPKVNRVWGLYDIEKDGGMMFPVGQAPLRADGTVWYEAFKWSPYADATFPIRKEAFIPWDVTQHSLNDWEYSIRLLRQNDYKGDDWKYVDHSFFAAEYPVKGGLSDDSHKNWEARRDEIWKKNGIVGNDIVVTSLGARQHAYNVAKIIPADFLSMPSFKPHSYKMVYLLGFYSRENGRSMVTKTHMDVFERNKGVNVIHWIGTDIVDLFWHCSYMKIKAMKKWFKKANIIHLCEADFTKKELAELGIDAKVIPIPPQKLYEPMPLPEEFSVGIYLPNNMYKPNLVNEIIKSMPDIKFYLFGDEGAKGQKGDNWEALGYIDYDEWIPKMSCNLRILDHDGLPITPLQFLTAGRNVVTNTPVKGAIIVKPDRENIVEGIRKAQETQLDPKVAQYWREELSYDKYRRRLKSLYRNAKLQ